MELFRFRLYLAGDTPNSSHALANLSRVCNTRLRDCHEIEVVDVFREPMRALAEGIIMTPTLLKLAPGPAQRIVGNLSDTETLLAVLGLEQQGA
jgi:circadian clock protein KaiB